MMLLFSEDAGRGDTTVTTHAGDNNMKDVQHPWSVVCLFVCHLHPVQILYQTRLGREATISMRAGDASQCQNDNDVRMNKLLFEATKTEPEDEVHPKA